MKPQEGSALVRPFASVIEGQGIQLRKEKGERRGLGLETADQVIAGYYS